MKYHSYQNRLVTCSVFPVFLYDVLLETNVGNSLGSPQNKFINTITTEYQEITWESHNRKNHKLFWTRLSNKRFCEACNTGNDEQQKARYIFHKIHRRHCCNHWRFTDGICKNEGRTRKMEGHRKNQLVAEKKVNENEGIYQRRTYCKKIFGVLLGYDILELRTLLENLT